MAHRRSKKYPLYKRGNLWTYDFRLGKKRYRRSTRCKNIEQAKIVYRRVWKQALEEWDQSVKATIRLSVRKQVNDKWKEEIALAINKKGSWLRKLYASIQSRANKWPEKHLTFDELTAIAYRSDGRCEVTGIPFSKEKVAGSKRPPYAHSIDRIKSSVGYTAENCRLVCQCVNVAMLDWGEGVLERIAHAYNFKVLSEALENPFENNDTTF